VSVGRAGRDAALAGAVGVAAGVAAGTSAATGTAGWSALAGIALALGVVASLLGHLRTLFLALIVIDVPLQVDINLGYRTDVADLAALGGFNVSLTTVALAGLYLLWIAELLVGGDAVRRRPRLGSAFVPALLVAIAVFSLAVASDRVVAGFEIALLAQMLLLFVYVASTVRTRSELRLIVMLLLAGMLLESVVALASWASGGAFAIPGSALQEPPPPGAGGSRLSGTIGGPNGAGGYFAFMIVLGIAILLLSHDRSLRRLAAYACPPAFVALALTQSRGAWIALVLGGVALMIAGGSRLRRAISPAAAVGIGVALLAILIPLQSLIANRISGPDEGSAASRGPLARLAFEIIGDHPIAGVGANNFAIAMPDYAGAGFSGEWLSIAHNKYLLVWAELGTLGLAAFVTFLVVTVMRGLRVRRAADPLVAAVGIGIAAAVIGHAAHLNFDTFKGRAMTEMIWLASALLASPAVAGVAAARHRSAIHVPQAGAVAPARTPSAGPVG
jgi:putative inorganic carbon (hco3(-)) transporter